MHECYAMQILDSKKKKKKNKNKTKEQWSQRIEQMKHKNHVRKTQLGRVFCIQNLLDAPRALEFLFT